MKIEEIAREVLLNYTDGIKIWQLQEEAKYYNVDTNTLFKKLCELSDYNEEI